jgi:hypothetical protein
MPHHATRLRPAIRLAVLLAASVLAAACDRTPTGDSTVPATSPAAKVVSYDNDTLTVGDAVLHQFPDYQRDTAFSPPPGWPTESGMAIESKDKPIGAPQVAAAVLRDDAPVDPSVLMRIAEAGVGLENAPVIAEGSRKGAGRECFYRVRAGRIDGRPDKPAAVVGTVIVTGQPASAVTIDTGLEEGESTMPVEDLTHQVILTLCPPA